MQAFHLTAMIALMLLSIVKSFAQGTNTQSEESSDFLELSLEELMSIEIVSASRQQESSFDVPLSSFVVTGKEIELMGATSIPEALRIVPGVIVREVSNGCYDVSLRGGVDGLPSHGFTYANTSILVMIDNRPVFSYLEGGTFWQNLPVGMAEIDRIEVVHGPVSSLYGPNAVSGVINILTSRPRKGQTFYGSATGFVSPISYMGSALIGANLGDNWSVDVAVNYENRQKHESTFYDPSSLEYVELDQTNLTPMQQEAGFPNEDESLDKIGASLNIYYQSENVDLKLTGSHNNTVGLYPFSVGLALNNFTNNSENIVLAGNVYGFTILSSYLSGTQGLNGNNEERIYDYTNTDVYLDYLWKVGDQISIRPAISYQSTGVDDTRFTVDQGRSGAFNGEGSLNNFAPSLKVELNPTENWRFILGGRYDIFNHPEDGVFSYQGIVNYKLSDKHLLRFVTGKSYNSSFLIPTLINVSRPLGPGLGVSLQGNRDLDLLSNVTYELGYRGRVFGNSILDIAFFSQQFENFSVSIAQLPDVDPVTQTRTIRLQYDNLPLSVRQMGATISLQSTFWGGKLQLRPNVTIQQTRLFDYSPYYNVEGAFDNPQSSFVLGEHVDNVEDIDGEYTPEVFGGLNAIVNPIQKLSINISGYYFSKYVMDLNVQTNFGTGEIINQDARNIDGKLLLNANVNYSLMNNFSAFVYGSNLLNNDAPEGFGADRLGFQAMLGLRYRL